MCENRFNNSLYLLIRWLCMQPFHVLMNSERTRERTKIMGNNEIKSVQKGQQGKEYTKKR